MKNYYAWLAAALLTGCHRETETAGYDLTGTYTASSTVKATNPIRMFTQAGEVNNPTAVSRFLARRTSLAAYFSSTDVVSTSGGSTTLTFRANSRATLVFRSGSYTDSIKTEVTDKQQASFLLQNVDSISLSRNSTNQAPCDHSNELVEYVRGADWGRACRSVPSATGYRQLCRVRPLRAVGVRGSQLYIPYYSWIIQAGGCFGAVSGDWNTFNPVIVSHLLAGDTVVVQEREQLLSR